MSFIQLNRESTISKLIMRKRPTAFVLLALIAQRAKRSDDHPDKTLEIGEAFIGDYESYGVTKQVYRRDKMFLETNTQVTLRTTNRGTIAKLISSDIFDINENGLTHKKIQSEHTTNTQRTPNNNDNNEKKEIQSLYNSYKELINKDSKLTENAVKKIKTRLKSFSLEDLLTCLKNFSGDEWWMSNNSHRGIAWFFDSDDRIDSFRTLKPKQTTVNLGINFNSLPVKNDSNT